MRGTRTVVAGAVLVTMMVVLAGGCTRSPSRADDATPTTLTVTAKVEAWDDANAVLLKRFVNSASDAPIGSNGKCHDLGPLLKAGRAAGPIPDAALEATWRQALDRLQQGSAACVAASATTGTTGPAPAGGYAAILQQGWADVQSVLHRMADMVYGVFGTTSTP